MHSVHETFGMLIIIVFFLAIPLVLTVKNIKLLAQKKPSQSPESDLITIVYGLFCTFTLTAVTSANITDKDYCEAVYPHQFHALLHSEYGIEIKMIIFLAYVGLFILVLKKTANMSPLTAAFSIAFIYLGIVAALFILIQLMKHFSVIHLFLYLYFANLIMISVRLIRFHIQEHIRIANERETEFRSKSGRFFHKIMTKTSSMNLFCFILTLPITAVFEIIYIICGQGPDGFIKAFTMTADWTFSTQIPPPPIDYEGHYLCTVAAGGHKEIVKPLRYGKRQNAVIVVNRQLLVANAFEDLIQEKLPRVHCVIRGFYDKHGYPVSRFITTRSRADAVYIMMKPLEFIFILTLYLFDRHPENRIAVQYSEYKESL